MMVIIGVIAACFILVGIGAMLGGFWSKRRVKVAKHSVPDNFVVTPIVGNTTPPEDEA